MAEEIPMEPATLAIAEEAKAGWVSQVPESWAVVHAVVTSVEEC